MSDEIVLSDAYVLHTRPYRETSALVELFSQDIGRFNVVARGVRRPKSKLKSLLQPFIPVLVSAVGRGELKTLTHLEAVGRPLSLHGRNIISGFYLNELIQRLLPVYDPMPALYQAYQACITALIEGDPQRHLRQFELTLLSELGYAMDFSMQYNGQAIVALQHYGFSLEHGCQPKTDGIPGETLLALAAGDWDNPDVLKAAKFLTRVALKSLLGNKPLASRDCYFREVVNG